MVVVTKGYTAGMVRGLSGKIVVQAAYVDNPALSDFSAVKTEGGVAVTMTAVTRTSWSVIPKAAVEAANQLRLKTPAAMNASYSAEVMLKS